MHKHLSCSASCNHLRTYDLLHVETVWNYILEGNYSNITSTSHFYSYFLHQSWVWGCFRVQKLFLILPWSVCSLSWAHDKWPSKLPITNSFDHFSTLFELKIQKQAIWSCRINLHVWRVVSKPRATQEPEQFSRKQKSQKFEASISVRNPNKLIEVSDGKKFF